MEIGSPYYQAKSAIIFLPICSNCEMNNDFVDKIIIKRETSYRKARPLCIEHHQRTKETNYRWNGTNYLT